MFQVPKEIQAVNHVTFIVCLLQTATCLPFVMARVNLGCVGLVSGTTPPSDVKIKVWLQCACWSVLGHDTEPHFAPEAAPSLYECIHEPVNTLIASTITGAIRHTAGSCLQKFKSQWMLDLQRSEVQGEKNEGDFMWRWRISDLSN